MSNTNITIELLSAFIDGELTDDESNRVEEAIRNDAETRRLYDKLKSTTSMFAELQPVDPPPRLKLAIADKIRNSRDKGFLEDVKERFSKITLFNPAVFAAAATLLLMIIGLYSITVLPFTPQSETQFAKGEAAQEEMLLAEAETATRDVDEGKSARFENRARMAVPQNNEAIELDEETFAGAEPSIARSDDRLDAAPGQPVADSGPMYRADIIQTYYEPSSEYVDFSDDTESRYNRHWGREMVFNPESVKGVDENPFVQTSERLPPEMPGFNFIIRTRPLTSSVLVEGVVHVAASGRILYFDLTGPIEAQEIINAFALQLEGQSLKPVYQDGKPVSVLYRFIAMLYPASSVAE